MNKIGALIVIKKDKDVFEQMKTLKSIGCECCQLSMWDTSMYTDDVAEKILAAANEYGIEISTHMVLMKNKKQR